MPKRAKMCVGGGVKACLPGQRDPPHFWLREVRSQMGTVEATPGKQSRSRLNVEKGFSPGEHIKCRNAHHVGRLQRSLQAPGQSPARQRPQDSNGFSLPHFLI